MNLREAQSVPASTADSGKQQAATAGVHGASYEANIVYARSPQVALSVSAVHRAVELRAKTLAMMLLQYQTKDKIGGNFQQDTSRYGSGLNWLLQVEPNPIMTAASLIEQVIIDRLNRGNGLIYIERDYGGDVVALWRAQYGGYNALNGTYTLTYLTDKGLRSLVNVPAEDVIHLPNTYREVDGVVGISTIRHAYDTLSLIKTQKAQALDTAAKGGRVKGFISEDKGPGQIGIGSYNKQTSNDYAKEISDKIYEQDIVSLRGLEKFTSISMSAQDMELVAQLNLGLDDVARFWATPRPLLMLDTNSHYTSYKDATMEYLQRTIAPDAREIEDEFNRKLLNRYDFGKARIHMCELPLLRMDLESQAKVDQYRLQMGWTINEIRQQYDMPAVEKGDIPYRTANVKPLGEEEAAATELPPGNYKVPAPASDGGKKEGEDKP
jgi:HK97 family phage portal protein